MAPMPDERAGGRGRRGARALVGGELRQVARLSQQVLVAAALVGVTVGAAVGAFDRVVAEIAIDELLHAPAPVQVVAPMLGLLLSAAALRWIGDRASPATSDEYLRAFHGKQVRFDRRAMIGRVAASAATLGSGGAMGLEGPSVYLGAGIGHAMRRRVRALLSDDDLRLMLVAGAAAGIGAIFKAPATGAVFALEVPFRNELARRSLLPALIGSATGYLTFVAINGTTPLFAVAGNPTITGRDLGGAALVGVTCGVGARAFAWVVRRTKELSQNRRPLVTAVLAGVVLGILVVTSRALFDGDALSLGPGYQAVAWSLEPDRGLVLLVLLATIRVMATAASITGRGTGGLFVPLVVQGALTGRAVGALLGSADQTLYPVLGMAAFLGAGYRVPLAAVMFVAETTGRPGFVVPGLVAAVLAALVGGDRSITAYQRDERAGHVERRADLPLTAALLTDAATARPTDSLAELFTEHVALARRRAIPVVAGDDGGSYQGMILLDDVLAVPHDRWVDTPVSAILRLDLPALDPAETIGHALAALARTDAGLLPVVDDVGRLRGLVSRESILDLDELLERLEREGEGTA
jgi:chloride channel protein, CIC family